MDDRLDKWKKAVKNLEDFNEMMEKIKSYLKSPGVEVRNNIPYTIEGPIQY
jgi:hypothetical protein